MNALVQNAKTYAGDFRRLTRFIALAIAAFSVVLIAIIAWIGWSANKSAEEAQRTLIDNAINQSIAAVLNEQKSIAWWDDSIIYMSGPRMDRAWVDANFGVYLYETYQHEEIYIVDPDGKPVYAYLKGEPAAPPQAYQRRAAAFAPLLRELRTGKPQGFTQRPDAFSADQSNYRILAGSEHARWNGHVLALDGKPAVVTAIIILPNVDMSLMPAKPHIMISVVPVDQAFMQEIGRALLIPDLAISPAQPRLAKGVVQPFVTDDHAPSGFISWTPRRPGQGLLTVILPLVILAVGCVGWFSATMLRRLRRASTELAEREARARYESKHDPLSGLPNRHHFAERLTDELDARRAGGRHIVVAYIDLDRFKDVNDTLGHHAGDALIRAISHRLTDMLGPDDFLSRFGGDEFAVLRASNDPADANALTAAIMAAFAENFLVLGQNIVMTASVGVAAAPEHGDTTDQLMRHADIALYEAKDKGRDRSVLFSHEMAWQVEDRRAIELDLRQAIDADLLTLCYQPIVSAATGKTIAVEALLRWEHPDKGPISPAVFVPIAENAGLMPKLGAWVIDHALAQAAQWANLQVTINLSPVQFRHVDLESELPRALARHRVDSRRVILEVTEGVLLEATEKTRLVLESLRRMGFQIALDDFGTGYSSLAYLSTFSFDKLKIDRSFVSGIGGQKKLKTIVQSVVQIGRGLGMQVVAEGVESEAEAAMMRLFGCQEMQGYFFSKPVTAAEIEKRLSAEAAPSFAPYHAKSA